MEAFKSLERTEPHSGQVHSRSFSVSSLLIYPHSEHVFELGSNLPILRMFTPFHFALYSSMVTNIPQDTSEIEPAKQWFFSIPEIFKSSKAIDWFSRINSVLTLCKKSFLWLATFSCSKATLYLRLVPLCLEYWRWLYFSLSCDLRKYLGLSYSLPFEATKYVLIPKSTPTVVFSLTGFSCFSTSPVSQRIDTKYLPVGVLLIVACLIVPFIGLCNTISLPFLNLGIISLSLSIFILCGMLKDCFPLPFFLNLGKSARPLKKFSKAVFILTIDCCKDWLFTSFNHSFSFFKSGSLLTRLYQEWLVLSLAYSDCLKAKALLYTKRAQPICLLINSACNAVGEILYLNAFSILQIYKIY